MNQKNDDGPCFLAKIGVQTKIRGVDKNFEN